MGRNELAAEWNDAGIREGEVLLLHSSVSRVYRRFRKRGETISVSQILDSFLDAIGTSGTLLMPLFNFEFTQGTAFDINRTPSKMGALTEAARQHPAAVRTGHPIYSFAVIGKLADEFASIDNFSGYGSDSPFALLHEMDGRIAVLDLPDRHSMTFYHHVEEMNDVPYRFHKRFTGDYTTVSGDKEVRTYGLFVRDTDKGVQTNVDPAGELMWEAGLYEGCRPGEGSGLRTVSASTMYTFVTEIISSGRAENLLYRTGPTGVLS